MRQALSEPHPVVHPTSSPPLRWVCSGTRCFRPAPVSSRGSRPSSARRPWAGDERDPHRHRVRPPAVRPLPGLAAGAVRHRDRQDPALGGDGPRSSSGSSGLVLRRCSAVGPAHGDAGAARQRSARSGACWTMARQGLAVLRTFPAAVAAILFQTAGWVLQLLRRLGGDGGVRHAPPALVPPRSCSC